MLNVYFHGYEKRLSNQEKRYRLEYAHSKSMDLELFEVKETTIERSDGSVSISKTQKSLEKVKSILLINFY